MATKKDPAKAMRIPGFFTCEQAAEELGMKADTVRRYVHRGLIEVGLIGDVYLISKANLKKFKDSRRDAGRPPKTREKQSA